MSNVKTIILSGKETKVDFGQRFTCFWVRNMGNSAVYASTETGVEPEADGVVTIDARASARVMAADLSKNCSLYLMGSVKVQVVGSDFMDCPFKNGGEGGGSGSGGGGGSTINIAEKITSESTIEEIASAKSVFDYVSLVYALMMEKLKQHEGYPEWYEIVLYDNTKYSSLENAPLKEGDCTTFSIAGVNGEEGVVKFKDGNPVEKTYRYIPITPDLRIQYNYIISGYVHEVYPAGSTCDTLIISDRGNNGFGLSYTGAAECVNLRIYVKGGAGNIDAPDTLGGYLDSGKLPSSDNWIITTMPEGG